LTQHNDINIIVSRLPRRTARSVHMYMVYIAQCQDTHTALRHRSDFSDECRHSASWPPTRCESAGRLLPSTSSISPCLPLFRNGWNL